MPFEKYLTRARIVDLVSNNREDAFDELVSAISRTIPSLDREQTARAIRDRERLTSTRIGHSIAIPHARIEWLDTPVIAVGRSEHGVDYDRNSDDRIYMIAMILANEDDHLRTLQGVVARLSARGLVDRVLRASDADEVFRLLTTPVAVEPARSEEFISRAVLENAMRVAARVNAVALLLHVDGATPQIEWPEPVVPVIVFSPSTDLTLPDGIEFVHFPFPAVRPDGRREMSLLFARAAGLVGADARVVVVMGDDEQSGWNHMSVCNTSAGFQKFLSPDLFGPLHMSADGIDQRVFARVLQLATTIAQEGREGEPVGTMFVLGDTEQVLDHCQQLIANPFKGYEESERNVLDPSMEESIKEFARIDGAFVIRNDGVIESAGTYIRASNVSVELPRGLGSRHMAAASITTLTDSIAVALSQSTRTVSIFRRGSRIFTT